MEPIECCNKMDWIIPGQLLVGDMDAAKDFITLKKHKVGGIITAREDLSAHPSLYMDHGIQVLHIPISDHENTNIGIYFPLAYQFIRQNIKQGNAVLVHCAAGISRSTSIVIAYIMRRKHKTPEQAINYVRSKRPCTNPNTGFLKQLNIYYQTLQSHQHKQHQHQHQQQHQQHKKDHKQSTKMIKSKTAHQSKVRARSKPKPKHKTKSKPRIKA